MVVLNIPNKFTGGTNAIAMEVNENFSAISAYANEVNNVLDELKTQLAEALVKPSKDMFDIYYAITTKAPTGAYPLWTGETITNARLLFPDFWAELLLRKASGTIKTVASEQEYTEIVEEYGQCTSFYVDELNGHVRLPKITKFIQSITDSFNFGDIKNDGLPNITGTTKGQDGYARSPDATGAFTHTMVPGSSRTGDGGYTAMYSTFDASLSNEIYGNSDVVQPASVCLGLYIQIANNTTEISKLDTNIITELLNEAIVDMESEKVRVLEEINSYFSINIKPLMDESEASSRGYAETSLESKDVAVASAVTATEQANKAQTIADNLGSPLDYKGRVDTVDELPLLNNKIGDFYFVGLVAEPQKDEYIWDGYIWQLFGNTTDFEEIEARVLQARDEAVASATLSTQKASESSASSVSAKASENEAQSWATGTISERPEGSAKYWANSVNPDNFANTDLSNVSNEGESNIKSIVSIKEGSEVFFPAKTLNVVQQMPFDGYLRFSKGFAGTLDFALVTCKQDGTNLVGVYYYKTGTYTTAETQQWSPLFKKGTYFKITTMTNASIVLVGVQA